MVYKYTILWAQLVSGGRMGVARKKLTECSTMQAQLAWIERALREGKVLSDAELWLAGVDSPEDAVDRLRKRGLCVETVSKKVIDAADVEHDDIAWRMAEADRAEVGEMGI